MCTPFVQMNACYSVKAQWTKFVLHPEMWIVVGRYHNFIYDTNYLINIFTDLKYPSQKNIIELISFCLF